MKQIKEILIASVSLFLLGFGICMAVSTFFMYREGEQEYETLREYVKEEERKNGDGIKLILSGGEIFRFF